MLEDEELEESVVKGGEGGEGLDKLQRVLPLKQKCTKRQSNECHVISRKKSKLRKSRKGGSIRSVFRAGGAVINLPLGAGAVITNYGSGSLLYHQRLGRKYIEKSNG